MKQGTIIIDPTNRDRQASVTADGKLKVEATTTNTGGATEAKQDTQITNFGAPADTMATSDTGTFGFIALFKRLLDKLTNRITTKATLPYYTSSSFISVATNADGTTYTAFASTVCDGLQVENNTGTEIEIQKGGTGGTIRIPSGIGGRYFSGISNANQLAVRRTDLSTTSVTVRAEAITL